MKWSLIKGIWAVSSTFMHVFQNNLAQLFIRKVCSSRLKTKVTLEGQMRQWSQIELVRVVTCTFMHGLQYNLVQLFSRGVAVPFETSARVD